MGRSESLPDAPACRISPRMKRTPLLLLLSLSLTTVAFAQKADKKRPAASPAAPAAPAPAKKGAVQNVTPDAAEKLIAERKDIIVVDVRTVEEYDMAHIPGAKNISVIDSDFDELLKTIEGKPVLVHCAAGVRSMRAVMKMEATGKFPEIYHLTTGFSAWQQAGKSVVKTAKPAK